MIDTEVNYYNDNLKPDEYYYEGHIPGPWKITEGQPYDDEVSYLDIVDVNGVLVTETSSFTDCEDPNIRLIADAPSLLKGYVRLRHCLRYVGARLYLDKIGRRPYDYTKLLEFCMDNTGEPDDLSGKMGAMIEELSHLDEKLEVDKEMIE